MATFIARTLGGNDGATVRRHAALDAQHAARAAGTADGASHERPGRPDVWRRSTEAQGPAEGKSIAPAQSPHEGQGQAQGEGAQEGQGRGQVEGQARQCPRRPPSLVRNSEVEEGSRVDASRADVGPEVEMGPRGAARRADGADWLTAGDALAVTDHDVLKVEVQRVET